MIVISDANYLKILHCGYRLMVPNTLLKRLELSFPFGNVLRMCNEPFILLFCHLNN